MFNKSTVEQFTSSYTTNKNVLTENEIK